MAVSTRTLKILWGKAGATCSFPGCRRKLVADKTELDGDIVLGRIAHIVAREKDGPRGHLPPPGGDIDGYENLVLLCEEHHTLVDGQPNTYTVEKLIQMRKDHESSVDEWRGQIFQQESQPEKLVKETIHSTLLPVSQMPRYIYSIPCNINEADVKDMIVYPADSKIMLPFIVRGGELIAFCDLTEDNNPFHQVVSLGIAERSYAQDWWEDPDLYRWYVTLLNRALNKLTGRKGLNLDKAHSRYYFEPGENGQMRSVTYKSLQSRDTTRNVAWRPKFRRTDELKKYWEHLAVGLRFHRVTETDWCLSVRPERRFTRDGYNPLTIEGTGRRSSSRKSHMYNIDVLTEVNFWRDYLSDGSPRIILKFGSQNLIVETEMMSTEVLWPGVPGDTKRFNNIRYQEDLFTYTELQAALAGEIEDNGVEEEWEDEDYSWEEDSDE